MRARLVGRAAAMASRSVFFPPADLSAPVGHRVETIVGFSFVVCQQQMHLLYVNFDGIDSDSVG